MQDNSPFFDEMLAAEDAAREPYADYHSWFSGEDMGELRKKATEAETFFRRTGITFNVYGAAEADERLIPFDIVPRIISAREWARLTRGIEQRGARDQRLPARHLPPARRSCARAACRWN